MRMRKKRVVKKYILMMMMRYVLDGWLVAVLREMG